MDGLTSISPPRKRAWLAAAAVMLTVSALSATHTHAATHALDSLIDAVIRNGPDAELPAHLSVVLGVSPTGQPTAVKQAVIREGTIVRTFNVCKGAHGDVVILTYDEQRRSTQAYLLSSTGILRKAVTYQTGAPAAVRSPAEAHRDFARELDFWAGFAGRPNPAGPK